jgi:NAD(P)-dependent dehydrogenase (short-subunit alcohol dehydrogenase family)
MNRSDLAGKVALVTGGANGIGAGVAMRLASHGAHVVVADTDEAAGAPLAGRLDGLFVRTDVREMEANEAAVGAAVERFGGLDIVHLNAGVSTGFSLGDTFDIDGYRRAMAINIDGVVFGAQAALPALRGRGGGSIVATASMAGLVSVPLDPIYCANKHAVVGLARALGDLLAPEGILVNALCPSFAETAIIEGIKPYLEETGFPILSVDDVVDTFVAILESGESGQCWHVVPGREAEPFRFRNAPGPRTP